MSSARQVLDRCQKDPAWFSREVLGVELWSKQRDILASVRDHRRTAVRSCHGIGKTFTAADVALWFLYSFPDSRVVTTATTWPQVEKLLWHEVNQLHSRSLYPLGGRCLTTELKLDDGRFAIGLSTRPEHKESFQGHHAENILLIFDEASGIPAPIYEAGEGYMTSAGARWLMIGNPTRPEGEFYNAFHKDRDSYNTIHVAYHDTPAWTGEQVSDRLLRRLISPTWVEEKRRSWGEDSPLWQVRVLGDFPSTSDNTVVSLTDVEAAQRNTITPCPEDTAVVGADVARFGTDETVISVNHGGQVRIMRRYTGRDLMQTVGAIIDVARQVPCHEFPALVVDDDGLGGGVTDRLREQGYHVTAFRAGEAARDRRAYPNRRSEHWFDAAHKLPTLDLDGDEQLAADLLAPRYKLDSQGRRVVEPKDETKKRIGRSPDRADSVLLTLIDTDTAPTEGDPFW